jgi:hypothetical protein
MLPVAPWPVAFRSGVAYSFHTRSQTKEDIVLTQSPHASIVSATLLILLLARETRADDPPAAAPEAAEKASERLADSVKDAVKGAVKDALDGTLKDKATEAVNNALTTPADDGSKETKIVLRVSKEFIRQHAPPVVEHVAPVNKCLFGSRVTGTAHTRGRPALTMDTDHSKPVFTLHFKGTTTTKTVASKHPVKAYNTGVAMFDVHRQIRFDGMQFVEGPESIEATYASTLDCLATPPGIRGRIVRKFAMPQIDAMKPKADAIALADTKASVLEAFGKHTDELVSDLNARLPWKQTLALLVPQDTQWSGHFASTKDWILASPGPKEAGIPELPAEDSKAQAPIELWVHGKPGDGTAAKVVALWSAVHFGLNKFRANASQDPVKLEDIKPAIVGEWWVIRVGADLVEDLINQLEDDEQGA